MAAPTIVFDVNETLSDLAGLGDAFASVGADPELASTWFASTLRDGLALTIAGGAVPFGVVARPVLRGLLAARGLHDDDATLDTVLDSFAASPPHDDVAPAVRALAEAGFRMATLSNGTADAAGALLDRAGVLSLVPDRLGVEHTGLMKPDRRAYLRALDRLGVRAADAVLVAVHPWDVHGAAAAGMRTAAVRRTAAPWPEPFRRGDVEVSALTELVSALRPD